MMEIVTFDLLDLLLELREEVYAYCATSDLVNIACCSHAHYESLLYLLWKNVRIPWNHVEQKSLVLAKNLGHLNFTSSLSFFGNKDGYGDDIRSFKVGDNIPMLFEHCDPVILAFDSFHKFDCEEVVTQAFQNLFNVEQLSFRKHVLTGKLLNISKMHALTILFIDSCFINDDDVKDICKLVGLQELTLTGESSLGSATFEHLSNLNQLRRLILSGVEDVESTSFEHLTKLVSLKDLYLCSTQINNSTLDHICKCMPNLESIGIVKSPNFSHEGVWSLTNCRSLTELFLSNCMIGDKSLDHICKITTLVTLELSSTNITDDGMQKLGNLTALESLNLGQNDIKCAGVSHLKPLSKLQELYLFNTSVSDEAMLHISLLSCLRKLRIDSTGVTDEGFKHLCKLVALQELYFYNTSVSDVGVLLFVNHKRLRVLETRSTETTKEGLDGILELPHFKGLKIYGHNCY